MTKEKKDKTQKLANNLEEAEKKASARENKTLKEAIKVIEEAGLGVHKPKKRSNIKHVQFIQSNFEWLKSLPKGDKQKLSQAEKALLIDLVPYVKFGTNSICKKNKNEEQVPCNITELAEILDVDRSNLNLIIKNLIRKGVLGEFETGIDSPHPKNEEYNNPGKQKILYVNPRLMHSGYNDEVEEHLQEKFKNSLSKAPVKLF